MSSGRAGRLGHHLGQECGRLRIKNREVPEPALISTVSLAGILFGETEGGILSGADMRFAMRAGRAGQRRPEAAAKRLR